VTYRNIYRSVAGGSRLYFVATLHDNATTSYTDTASDASLGATGTAIQPPTGIVAPDSPGLVAIAYIYTPKRKWAVPDGQGAAGFIQEGDAMVTVMPDELPLKLPDRLVRLSTVLPHSEVIARGSDSSDSLTEPFAVAIDSITVGNTTQYVAGVDYELGGAGTDSPTVHWIGSGPAQGVNYAVQYRYNPVYFFNGGATVDPRSGMNGTPLALSGALTLKHPDGSA
jgi:hypothetical protein